MTCKHCGVDIKDGLGYCLECGEPTDDKVVIKTITKIPIEAQPLINFSGYVKALKSNTSTLVSLLGALCLYLSPFMKWMAKTIKGEIMSAGLFDIGAKNGDFSIGEGKITIYAILILVIGLYMLVMSGRKYFKPTMMHADNIIMRVVPIVLAIVVFVLIISNKTYDYHRNASEVKLYSSLGSILFVLGIVLYAVSIFMDEKKRS